jgi:hypothetical protein
VRGGGTVNGIIYVLHFLMCKFGAYDGNDQTFYFGAAGPSSPQILEIAVDLYIAGTVAPDDQEDEATGALKPLVQVPGLQPDPSLPNARAMYKRFLEKAVSLTVRDATLTRKGILGPKPKVRFGKVHAPP